MKKVVQANEKNCLICGEVLSIGEISYCKKCRAEYNKDYYRGKVANKRFVYMLLGQDDNTLYVGSCIGKYRIKSHLSGDSHLKLRGNDWVQLGLNKLRYADVTNITADNSERYFIEKMYIQMTDPFLNSDNEPDPFLTEEKIEAFVDLIYNDAIEFKEIDIKKVTQPHSQVTFNFTDLILS